GTSTGGRETTSDGVAAAPSPSATAGLGTTGVGASGGADMRDGGAVPRVAPLQPDRQGHRRLLTRHPPAPAPCARWPHPSRPSSPAGRAAGPRKTARAPASRSSPSVHTPDVTPPNGTLARRAASASCTVSPTKRASSGARSSV